MDKDHADQVAGLLNKRNQLTVQYDAERVLSAAQEYIIKLEGVAVVGCVQAKPVQWYQVEILHLTVAVTHERRGIGNELLSRALERAQELGACLAQCTIRDGNIASEDLFRANGFRAVNRFVNPDSGNKVGIWQRVLVSL